MLWRTLELLALFPITQYDLHARVKSHDPVCTDLVELEWTKHVILIKTRDTYSIPVYKQVKDLQGGYGG